MVEKTLEDTELELNEGLDELSAIDTDLTPQEMINLFRILRKQFVIEYQKLITLARLHEKVENTAIAKQNKEQAQKIVIQVNQLDHDIADLEKNLQ